MTNAFDNLEECFLKYNHEWPFLLGAQFSAALDTIEAFRQIKWDDELSIKIFNRRNLQLHCVLSSCFSCPCSTVLPMLYLSAAVLLCQRGWLLLLLVSLLFRLSVSKL
ncbi:uncharacterized protein [Spinacia oleracea]|uniref:Uncharacterized protein isoform X2 n=1 Tax=Spinacia oleracea TaxID=3562 RepID=A0ABM3QMM2_SPIOL|nr:uncharacterized protein LOC110800562 isoform X2 [Spinacia oleracea]